MEVPKEARQRAVEEVRTGQAGSRQESVRRNGDLFEADSGGPQVGAYSDAQ